MPVEPMRECEYRTVGSLYLVGTLGMALPCDRLPVKIEACAICGEQPRFFRGISKINPYLLWGSHSPCECVHPTCPICKTTEKAYMMWVGNEYTSDSFIKEAEKLGVSKKIPHVPKDLELGTDWVFLAKKSYIDEEVGIAASETKTKKVKADGIFYAFIPERIELLLTESQATKKRLKELEDVGITPVIVPDDDEAHLSKRGSRTAASETRKQLRKEKKEKERTNGMILLDQFVSSEVG